MKPDVIIADRVPDLIYQRAEAAFRIHKLWPLADKRAGLAELRDQARGLITTFQAGFDAELLGALPKLEVISVYGTGAQPTFDLPGAKARGIAVANTGTDGTDGAVADLAMGMLLCLARQIARADQFVRAGSWQRRAFSPTVNVAGKVAGIVGLGFVGRQIAKRLAGFDVDIRYFGPRQHPNVPYAYYSDLVKLAADVDFLFVSCRGGPEISGLIDARVLEALGPDGLYIHTAQARIYDEAALIAALQENRIGGAALDTYHVEPKINPAFLGMDNVLLSPHLGAMTQEILDRRCEMVVANLQAHFSGGPVPCRLV